MASLQRRLNRSLVIQHAENLALIDGEDLAVIWKCSGYCRAAREGAIEFSIDADASISFERMDCFAFDLRRDPRRHHPIRPVLVGPDGISKKVSIPLLAPLARNETFRVAFEYRLPHCLSAGTDYYTATLSFEQDTIQRLSVRLRFLHSLPQWVRVYERRAGEQVRLLMDLRPRSAQPGVREYADHAEDVPAQCARIYMFSRPSLATHDNEAFVEYAGMEP